MVRESLVALNLNFAVRMQRRSYTQRTRTRRSVMTVSRLLVRPLSFRPPPRTHRQSLSAARSHVAVIVLRPP